MKTILFFLVLTSTHAFAVNCELIGEQILKLGIQIELEYQGLDMREAKHEYEYNLKLIERYAKTIEECRSESTKMYWNNLSLQLSDIKAKNEKLMTEASLCGLNKQY